MYNLSHLETFLDIWFAHLLCGHVSRHYHCLN